MKTETVKPSQMLLVWDENPEKISFYTLDRKSREAEWARASHNKYLNGDPLPRNHPINNLSEWLASAEGKASQIDSKQSIRGKFSEVVICGFIL